jgi:hypothetical protein
MVNSKVQALTDRLHLGDCETAGIRYRGIYLHYYLCSHYSRTHLKISHTLSLCRWFLGRASAHLLTIIRIVAHHFVASISSSLYGLLPVSSTLIFASCDTLHVVDAYPLADVGRITPQGPSWMPLRNVADCELHATGSPMPIGISSSPHTALFG